MEKSSFFVLLSRDEMSVEASMKIKEIIVVEGKDDTVAIKRAVDADTIETNGSAIGDRVIEQVKLAQQKGALLFSQIRIILESVFEKLFLTRFLAVSMLLPKEEALAKRKKGVGIEHASNESIRRALENIHEEMEAYTSEISWSDLVDAGLVGGEMAKSRRERMGKLLKIGYTNAKQLHKRLQMFQVSKESFAEAYKQVIQEEKNEGYRNAKSYKRHC